MMNVPAVAKQIASYYYENFIGRSLLNVVINFPPKEREAQVGLGVHYSAVLAAVGNFIVSSNEPATVAADSCEG